MNKLFVTLILLSFLSISNLTSASNMLTNAGFEDSTAGPWWGPWGDQHTGTYGDAGTGIGGSNSVKFVPKATESGTGDTYMMYDNAMIPVTPGDTIYGAIYAKTVNLINEEVYFKIDWYKDGSWVGTGGSSATLSGTNDWTLLQHSAVVPTNANHASLAFFINQTVDGGSGTAYFDNAYLDTSPLNK